MFIGSLPKQSVQQLISVADFNQDDHVYVCCSGQFRVESALKEQFPSLWISGNDVSLLSCALGYWLNGQSLEFRLIGDLEPLEQKIPSDTPRWRLAALLLALDLSSIKRNTAFGERQWSAMWKNSGALLLGLYDRLERYAGIALNDFYAGDLRAQAQRALEAGGVILTFTPTYKGGYERAYKALMARVEWQAPEYALWDNAKLPDFLAWLEREGGRFYVYCDHPLDSFKPLAKFERGRGRMVWLYGHNGQRHSLRAESIKSQAFLYDPVAPERLSAISCVSVVEIDSRRFNFLRERYLSRGIDFVNGCKHFLVLLDGKLAGGIAYQRSQYGDLTDLYLLSDFSITQARKVSKLIALLATSRDLIRQVERVYGQRFLKLYTTAFTDKPVSMKYRGVFEVVGRKPGMINYMSAIRENSLQSLYEQWWSRYAQNAH